MPHMNDKALQALTRAWVTSLVATLLLAAALAIAPVWGSYLNALPGALSLSQ